MPGPVVVVVVAVSRAMAAWEEEPVAAPAARCSCAPQQLAAQVPSVRLEVPEVRVSIWVVEEQEDLAASW